MKRTLVLSLVAATLAGLGACASAPPARAPGPAISGNGDSHPITRRRTTSDLPAPPSAAAAAPVPPAPPRVPRASGYVRLRGSPEIHLPGCPRVRRARTEGVVSARGGEGPPCFYCRRPEAIAWSR